jgi:HEAT repeat protein
MARSKALEAALEQLAQVRDDPTSPQSIALLRKVLGGRSSHAAARAAQLIGEHGIAALVPDLVAAFERFLVEPVKSDPGCGAKAAIAEALYRINAIEVDVFLRGIHHVQMEPVWGGKADTATELRGTCALALVRIHHPDYLTELADLLADREAPARRMAAQALAYGENPAAAPLLHLKALLGDEEPQVVSECLLALLKVAPSASLDFVARFLDRGESEIAEAAALALGGSRLPSALPILRQWWERTFDPTLRGTALLAIAMLKQDEALAHLLGMIATAPAVHARSALRALAIYRHDPKLRADIAAVLDERADAALRKEFSDAFGE